MTLCLSYFTKHSVSKVPPCLSMYQNFILLGWENPLEKGMAPHPVFLPKESPRTEEPAG